MDPYDKARAREAGNEVVIACRRFRGARFRLAAADGESMTVTLPQPRLSGLPAVLPDEAGTTKDDTMTTSPLDEALIEQLIEERIDARRARDFAKADQIRKTLDGMGLIIIDGKDEETGAFWTTWDVRGAGGDEPDAAEGEAP
ncbi:hypothetical protein [Kaistia soli]|uniref:hypothetical protein n=1 Tax=Kaistia soli TaxID=446684 RepID=UPI00111490F2|nr:hypothetical protein [Kaistia soli]